MAGHEHVAQQFKNYIVCQMPGCGRLTTPDDANHWLNQPHRERFDIRVQRCPEHWSEWALRHTREGRTSQNREAMRIALSQPTRSNNTAGPFPMSDKTDADFPSMPDIDRLVNKEAVARIKKRRTW